MSAYILMVDDNPTNLQVLGQTLQGAEYEVAMAMNGKDALSFLRNEIPDLILLDIMMPEMDGFQVCEAIKRRNHLKDIPIIFLTAKSDTEDIVRGFEVGGVDYITKPFQPRELLARVNTHVSLKRAREEIKNLRGIIPICANCHKIRDDDGFWENVDTYISSHTEAQMSHSICPDCAHKLYPGIDVSDSY